MGSVGGPGELETHGSKQTILILCKAAEDLPRLKDLGIDHVFCDMNHPAQVPIDTQLVMLRRLMRLIKA